MVFETEPVVERMNPVARMATRGDELVAVVALRLWDDALYQRRSDLTTSMVRINEHILHQPKWTLVEIVRHHVQVGSANDLTLEGLGDLHAIRGHTDGLEAGSLHRGVGPARTRQVRTRANSPKMRNHCRNRCIATPIQTLRSRQLICPAGITGSPLPPRRPRSWRGSRETPRRRGQGEQEDYPQPSRTSGESALLLRRLKPGRSRSRECPPRSSTTYFEVPWQTPRGLQPRMGTGQQSKLERPGGHPRRTS